MEELMEFINNISLQRWTLILSAIAWPITAFFQIAIWRLNKKLYDEKRVDVKLDELLTVELEKFDNYIEGISKSVERFKSLHLMMDLFMFDPGISEKQRSKILMRSLKDVVKTSLEVSKALQVRNLQIYINNVSEEDKKNIVELGREFSSKGTKYAELMKQECVDNDEIQSLTEVSIEAQEKIKQACWDAAKTAEAYALAMANTKRKIVINYIKMG